MTAKEAGAIAAIFLAWNPTLSKHISSIYMVYSHAHVFRWHYASIQGGMPVIIGCMR